MNRTREYFLVVADTLSISRAAKILNVSHQSLSQHIKSLEQEYDIRLFDRKPGLFLTPAGEKMRRMLRQIQVVENDLKAAMKEMRESKSGTVRLGIVSGRAKVLIPAIFPRLREEFPQVDLITVDGESANFERQLTEGKLDMYLGFAPRVSEAIRWEVVMREKMYVVISHDMLDHYFKHVYPDCIESFLKDGVLLNDFSHVPFIINPRGNRVRTYLDRYMSAHDICLTYIAQTSNNDMHALLSALNIAASFCSQGVLQVAMNANFHPKSISRLYAFPIAGFDQRPEFVLAYNKHSALPRYAQCFAQYVREFFADLEEQQLQYQFADRPDGASPA